MEVVTGAPNNSDTFTCLPDTWLQTQGILRCLHSMSALCGSWLPMKTTEDVICTFTHAYARLQWRQ